MDKAQDNLPFVSVIVPVYNGAGTIDQTIESLLKQTYPHPRYEILVVNNASTDNTKDIVESFLLGSGGRVRCVYEEKKGISYARNSGIEQAQGEIIAFTDDDCVVDNGENENCRLPRRQIGPDGADSVKYPPVADGG